MKKIVEWLILRNAIGNKEAELYLYGINSMLALVSPFILALGFGFIFEALQESVLVVLPFMILRKYSGGYHAKYLWQCILQSILIIGFGVFTASKAQNIDKLYLFVGGSIFSLIYFSPIDSKKRKLDDYEKKKYKCIVSILGFFWGIIYLILILIGFTSFASCLGIGIILAAMMQFPCFFSKKYFVS